MATTTLRRTLKELTVTELAALARRGGLEVDAAASRAELIEALAGVERSRLAELLAKLPRVRLKALCRARGLEDKGREKELLIARLLGGDLDGAQTTGAVPPHRRRRRGDDDPPL